LLWALHIVIKQQFFLHLSQVKGKVIFVSFVSFDLVINQCSASNIKCNVFNCFYNIVERSTPLT